MTTKINATHAQRLIQLRRIDVPATTTHARRSTGAAAAVHAGEMLEWIRSAEEHTGAVCSVVRAVDFYGFGGFD